MKKTKEINNTTEERNSFLLKSIWMVLAIFSIMSLLLAGCSTAPTKQTPVTKPTDTKPADTTIMETTQVKMDVKDQKSEVQNTQDNIEKIIADGTYDDVVEYTAPSGTEKIEIIVSVENDIVKSASIVSHTTNKKSRYFIDSFSAAMPDLVVGKKIDEISFPHTVAGSSLTSAAFAKHLKDLVTAHPVN